MKQLFLVLLLTLTFTSCLSGNKGISEVSNKLSDKVSNVVAPAIPIKLIFAGEKVPLENYDTRESLAEDLSVTMYMHSRTMNSMRNTKRYFAMIEPLLEQAQIPADFKYLAIAESNLNPEAYSYAKAAGLWQILATTGKEHGLEINSTVDERYNVEKSTAVAIKYLKRAKKRFGSWTMAAASYNVGMAGLARRAKSQQESNYYDIFLPTETMRYVFRILTFKIIDKNPTYYGFKLTEKDYFSVYDYEIVNVTGRNIDWTALAKKHNTNYKLLRELNPWIRNYSHPNSSNKTYKVKIPTLNSRKML